MANNAVINFSFTGLPEGYCFTTPQRFALDVVAGMTGYLPGQYNVVIDSETEPSADDREKMWHKLYPGGAPSGKIFKYYLGKWVTPHPIEAGGDERRIWVGNESDIWAYDGGDGTNPSTDAPTATTGAMWERDTSFDFRFPLGVGTSPAPASTTVSVGATGGEEKHSLTEDELPQITPSLYVAASDGSDPTVREGLQTTDDTVGGGTAPSYRTAVGANPYVQPFGGDSDGVVVPHNNMPPFLAVFFIKRTSRVYITA